MSWTIGILPPRRVIKCPASYANKVKIRESLLANEGIPLREVYAIPVATTRVPTSLKHSCIEHLRKKFKANMKAAKKTAPPPAEPFK